MKLFPFSLLINTNICLTVGKKYIHPSFHSYLINKLSYYSVINLIETKKGLTNLYFLFKTIPSKEYFLIISDNFLLNKTFKIFEKFSNSIYSLLTQKKGVIKNWNFLYKNQLIFNWLTLLKVLNPQILIFYPKLNLLYYKLSLKYLKIKKFPKQAPSIVLFFTPFKDKQILKEINNLEKISIGLNSGRCDPKLFTLHIPGSATLEATKLVLSIILSAQL